MSKNTDLGSLVNYIKGQVTGRLNAPAYTSATAFTGTIAGYLGFDTSGNILTSAGVGFSGSGTTNYIPKFTGSTSLGNSLIYDNGTKIGINNTNPLTILHVIGGDAGSSGRIRLTHGSGTAQIELYTEPSGLASILSANALSFETGGVERIRITSAGNIVINTAGTSAPNSGQLVNRQKSDSTTPFLNGIVNMAASNSSSLTIYYDGSVHNIAASYYTGGDGGAYKPLVFSTSDVERLRIGTSGGIAIGSTTTSGYAMTVTGVDGTNYSPSSIYRIIARFVNNTSENKGIGIGYHTNSDINAACIYGLGQGSAAFPAASIAFGVYNRSTSAYVIKFLISENTVKITNIPTSAAGLGTGDLWRDGETVKIAL